MSSVRKSLSFASIILLAAIGLPSPSVAQPAADNVHKQLRATRVENGGIKIDGRLNESDWERAQFVSDFLQKEPDEGAPPTNKVEAAILYDDDAIYVGARMYCDDPSKLRMHLDRRDVPGPAEAFIVMLDTFRDRRTAYSFHVNTSGIIGDRFHPEDNEQPMDYTFNAVWEAKTSINSDNWTAEFRIPFSQLRFNNQEELDWGINFDRWIPERNEDVFWIYTPRNEVGYASRFADLVGITGIKPSRRLELMPYVAGNGRKIKVLEGDPFRDAEEVDGHVGADLKMGLGPNLTLDATINPDFGQVEADPAEVNLSAYETMFEERRPFFTEGSQLFDYNGPTFFYSRRIGRAPWGFGNGDFVDRPNNTTILGASKITGRLKSGTSIGILGAVTEREYAKNYLVDNDSTYETEIEPATMYGVARIQQDFGANHSTAGIMLTGVHRDMDASDPLAADLRKDAVTGGSDFNIRLKGGEYVVDGHVGFSHVSGDSMAILATQRSSAHYFQRPDQDHVTLEPGATSMTGFASSLSLARVSGKHWLGGFEIATESPEFELNDIGILNAADDIDAFGYIVYRETTPGELFRRYNLQVSTNHGWNYGGDKQYTNYELYAGGTWLGFQQTWVDYYLSLPAQSDNWTRGGPLMKTILDQSISVGFYSDYRRTTQYGASFGHSWNELDGWYYSVSPSFSARIGNRSQIQLNPYYLQEEWPLQYVTRIDNAGGGEETYDSRYVFARLRRSLLSLQVRLNYYFTPDLSLGVYAEPFATSGHYFQYGELARAGDNELRTYGTDGTTATRDENGDLVVTDGEAQFTIGDRDFGYQSFRSNLVLRYEFRPGSTLYFVWQRNLEDYQDAGRMVRAKSLFESFGVSGEDFVALKISYWIPIS